jgi:hypothetical protein
MVSSQCNVHTTSRTVYGQTNAHSTFRTVSSQKNAIINVQFTFRTVSSQAIAHCGRTFALAGNLTKSELNIIVTFCLTRNSMNNGMYIWLWLETENDTLC